MLPPTLTSTLLVAEPAEVPQPVSELVPEIPQIAEYSGIIEIFFRLLSSLNMLSWANLMIPVMNTNRRYGSRLLIGL